MRFLSSKHSSYGDAGGSGAVPQVAAPTTADGSPIEKGTSAYTKVLAELTAQYGHMVSGFRDVPGSGGYTYRQYADGRIFIQVSGRPKSSSSPELPATTTGSGKKPVPRWLWPVVIGGSALVLLGGGYYFYSVRGR